MKSINIFNAGKHTSSSGNTTDFAEADLKASVEAYDPSLHEAPIVVGHPKDNGPAYGWISKLSYSEDGIEAEPIQLDAEFEEMVTAGRFKKRSASFYHPDSPNNPVPGVFYLRHVGFLGAQAPAVKGLRELAFSDSENEIIVEFSEDYLTASLWRRMRDWFIDKQGLEEANNIVPDYLVEQLENAARTPQDGDSTVTPQFKEEEEMTPEQIKALEDENTALKAAADKASADNTDFSEREAALAAREVAIATQAVATQIDGLVAAGKMLPAHKQPMVDFMASLDANETDISFGEAGKEKKLSHQAFMFEYLESQPVLVDYSDHDDDDDDVGDLTIEQLSQQAAEFKEKEAKSGRNISVTQAVTAVQQGLNKD